MVVFLVILFLLPEIAFLFIHVLPKLAYFSLIAAGGALVGFLALLLISHAVPNWALGTIMIGAIVTATLWTSRA